MRADLYIVRSGRVSSRTLAQKLILDGAVRVDGRIVRKASEEIPDGEHEVQVADTPESRYVSRGGLKLEAALDHFSLSVGGLTAADIGASTGGFTNCLLSRGAKRVFAVDAGHDQLHESLRHDPRVRSMEGCNARTLTPADLIQAESRASDPDRAFDGLVDLAVMDVSFISQTLLLPAVSGILCPGGRLVTLIKPQFELSEAAIGKHGIVKRETDRERAKSRVLISAASCGFTLCGVIPSPIEGGSGNREYLACFVR